MITATLIVINRKALLVGAKFTRSDAQEIVDYLQREQLTLEKIVIPHGNHDYYFGTEVMKQAFPKAIVLATQSTVQTSLKL